MLGARYVEYIHDELVSKLWPGTDPVAAREYRSQELLESAVARPFHSAFGNDAYPTVIEKAAALFHSLIANHPFHNGNKRTAVLAFDMFLIANGYFGMMGNEAMYKLAERTASYKERGFTHEQSLREILDTVREDVVQLDAMRETAREDREVAKLYKSVMRSRRGIRNSKLNTRISE